MVPLYILIIMVILIVITSLRYRYLLIYSDNEYVHVFSFIIVGIIFSGFSIIGVFINKDVETLVFAILAQLPLVISTIIYGVSSIRYKKKIAVVKQIVKNEEWK